MFWAGILIGFSIGLMLGVIAMALAAISKEIEQVAYCKFYSPDTLYNCTHKDGEFCLPGVCPLREGE